jgi:ATP-binding cassette subfamily B protein
MLDCDWSSDVCSSDLRAMDCAIVPVLSIIPRGWLILGMAGLAPAFVSGSASPASLAVGLSGILLAGRALSGISGGLAALSRAHIAWSQVAHLFHAAATETEAEPSPPQASAGSGAKQSPPMLVDASDVSFRYRPQGEPVLRGLHLQIRGGERILLEGSSGGGKSTLASLLLGLRTPESGLILLGGLDRHSLGDGWRKLATGAPQFHENHILSGTLAFNLLMGRNWPPSEADLAEAEALCLELGLGDLLSRMPSGLMQMVGETGWQLSHGERSRVYLARALLQNAPLTVLDESFAALDPETLQQCLGCAVNRAQTLMVIAHP